MLKDLFKSDQTRHAERIEELKSEQEALCTKFIEEGRKAGFTDSQLLFMWQFTSHSQHQHEYYYDFHTWITTTPIVSKFAPGYTERWPNLKKWFFGYIY